MKNSYQKMLREEYLEWSRQINDTIDKNLPVDFFCSTDRDCLIRDIETNLFLKYSPAIVCILEFSTKSYLYVSENAKPELDIAASELIAQGFGRALLSFNENHKNIFLKEIYPVIFETYARYAPMKQAKDLLISYNTLLRTANGEYQWYYHQMAVLACDDQGFPRYALKLVSNIHDYKKDDNLNFTIHKKGNGKDLEVVYSKDYLPHEIDTSLSEREKEVLKLVTDGYSTKMIADKLFISINTVSTHRKNVLRKLKR